MADETVRLRFLGEHGAALRSLDAVTAGTRKLSVAERDQARAQETAARAATRSASAFRGLDRDVGKAARGALAGSGAFRSLGRSIAFASSTFLGGFGLAYAVRAAIEELKDAAAASAQVNAGIRSTGGAAGVTAKQIDVLATALLRKTGVDDEAVKSAAAVLLTFTEVRNEVGKGNDVFTQTIRLARDMSARLGQDLTSSVLQLGKALQDPITGLTALRRAGVSFSTEQRDQIKALTESGQILQAQKIILREVAREFQGAAAAFGRTPAGQLAIFQESLRNLAGTYARLFTPEIAKATHAAQRWVDELDADPEKRKEFRRDIEGIAGAVGDVAHMLKTATDMVGGTKNALEILLGLKVVSVLRGWSTAMTIFAGSEAAAGGTGLFGAAAGARALTGALRAIPEVVAASVVLKVIDDATGNAISNWLFRDERNPIVWLEHQLEKLEGIRDSGAKTGKAPAPAGAKYTGKGQQFIPAGTGEKRFVPKGSNPTVGGLHQTAGLAGFPAHDIFVKPGTPVLAPEDGSITRLSGHDPAEGSSGAAGVLGYSLYFVGDSGTTYFMTHLAQVAPEGRYAKGQEIGTVAYHPRGSHVHVGQFSGNAQAAYAPSTVKANLKPGGGAPPKRPPRRRHGATTLQQLQLQLAQATVTAGKEDDRSALQALIAFTKQRLAKANLPISSRIDLLNEESGYLDQLAGLAPDKKKQSAASKSALIVIKNTLAEVGKLVDQAGLDKKFGPQLEKINDQLDRKLVTPETLARIRIQLGKISDAAKAAIDKAAKQVEARKQAFTDAWAQLSQDAFAAFDKETSEHVGPTRSILNQLIGEHDQAQIQQAVTDAKAALDDALAGEIQDTDSDILSKVRELVGKAALANAIDKAQSQVLGINPAEVSSSSLVGQLQSLLAPGASRIVDPEKVKQAQRAYDEAVYDQKVFDLGKQADLEDDAYQDARARLRDALAKSLADWGAYYANLGTKTSEAAGLFQTIWDKTLSRFPSTSGGTGGGTNEPGGSVAGVPGSLIQGTNGFLTGGPAGIYARPGTVIAAAGGFDGIVARPQLFLTGERGRERVTVTPLSGSTGGGAGPVVVELHGDLALADRVHAVVRDNPAISATISRQQGANASLRARSGRY